MIQPAVVLAVVVLMIFVLFFISVMMTVNNNPPPPGDSNGEEAEVSSESAYPPRDASTNSDFPFPVVTDDDNSDSSSDSEEYERPSQVEVTPERSTSGVEVTPKAESATRSETEEIKILPASKEENKPVKQRQIIPRRDLEGTNSHNERKARTSVVPIKPRK